MARKKNEPTKPNTDDAFSDLEADFFASGDDLDWGDEPAKAAGKPAPVAAPPPVEKPAAATPVAVQPLPPKPDPVPVPPPPVAPPPVTPLPVVPPPVPAVVPASDPLPPPPIATTAPVGIPAAPEPVAPPVSVVEPVIAETPVVEVVPTTESDYVEPVVPVSPEILANDEVMDLPTSTPPSVVSIPAPPETALDEPLSSLRTADVEEISDEILPERPAPAVIRIAPTASAFVDADPLPAVVETAVEDVPSAPAPEVEEEAPRTADVQVDEAQAPEDEVARAWWDAARTLEAEANNQPDTNARDRMLVQAAMLYRDRVGDWDHAEAIFRSVRDNGLETPEILKDLGDLVAARGEFMELVEIMEARAERLDDPHAQAEAFQDAALVARNNLRDDTTAIRLLERAIEADRNDYFSLRLLRDMYLRQQNWRRLPAVLEQMAVLAAGGLAAEYHVERGQVLESRLSMDAEALAAYHAARAADPTYTPALLALDRFGRRTGAWVDLSNTYFAEAERSEGLDATFWFLRAAHLAWTRAAAPDQAEAAFQRLLAAGGGSTERAEYRAFLASAGRVADLVTCLQQEATRLEGAAAATLLLEAGILLETNLSKPDEAISAYLGALEADPDAHPAAEALARIFAARGDRASLLQTLEAQLSRVRDQNQMVSLRFQIGEILEAMGQPSNAREHYQAILDASPSYLPAMDALERVMRIAGATEDLAVVLEQRAILSDVPEGSAELFYRAGNLLKGGESDPDRAITFYKRALEQLPDYALAIESLIPLLEARGDWEGVAHTLRRAALAAKEGEIAIGRFYRAARVYLDHLGAHDHAIACLRAAVELSPGFVPARILLRDLLFLQKDWKGVNELLRAEADASDDSSRRAWSLFLGAILHSSSDGGTSREIADAILAIHPTHPTGFELGLRAAFIAGDRARAADLIGQMGGEHRPESACRLCHAAILLAETGDSVAALRGLTAATEFAGEVPLPLRGLARLSESLGYWEEVVRILEAANQPSDHRDLGRLKELYLHDPDGALALYNRAMEVDPTDLVASLGVERLLTARGDHPSLAAVHAGLVSHTTTPAVQALHALLGAHLYENLQAPEEARLLYQVAFDARGGKGKAFEGLLRLNIASGATPDIVRLFEAVGQVDGTDVAAALYEAGDTRASLDHLQQALLTNPGDLFLLLQVERLQEECEEWRGQFETLGRLRTLVATPENQADLERRQRHLLSERLADSEDAWTFYQALYEQNPQDPEVLQALARIEKARGNTEAAVQYLVRYADLASDPGERAAQYRQAAVFHRSVNAIAEAREAYLKALTCQPEDADALQGLAELAELEEDWRAVVDILARQASLPSTTDPLSFHVRIATVWEEKVGDHAIAADAWRQVLDADPSNRDALTHLVQLTEETGDWSAFTEHGQALAQLLEGAERSTLLRRVGIAFEEELHRSPDALRFLEAASTGLFPDAEACRIRERIHTGRGEWEQVVGALLALAGATTGDERTDALLRAARIRAEVLHNRQGASEVYARALEVDPSQPEALRFQSTQLYENGDIEGAADLFGRMEEEELARDLDDFDVQIEVALFFFRFGQTLQRLGRTADAILRFEQTLKLNETHLASLEALGPLYIDRGNWEKADEVYRRLLRLTGGQGEPEYLARIYGQLGYVELHLGRVDKAKQRFNKALELRPNDVKALQGLARVLHDCGEWNNLLNVYNNIIFHARDRSEVVEAYLAKGQVLDFRMHLPEKAADHYRKSLNFDPEEPRALMRLAELAARKKEWPEAMGLAQRAYDANPQDAVSQADALLVRALCRFSTGDSQGAMGDIEEAKKQDVTLADALAVATPGAEGLSDVIQKRLSTNRW